MNFSTIDYIVFFGYLLFIVFLGLWVSREKKGHHKDAKDYFLASKALPWWAVGASLIAANISAEQIIGMSGSGFKMGLAIAAYEWMAAITLILIAKYFLPIYLSKGIYTMPQFLELRFDHRVRTILAIFWLALYVFVNLAAVAYLGGLALENTIGISLNYAIIGLFAVAALYSLYGGLKAVAWTDALQVVILIFGAIIITYVALDAVGDGTGAVAGFGVMLEKAPEKFDLIFSPEHPSYKDLPGVAILIGGMWIANLFYWGCNQYINQRALAAKNLREAQKGLAFAAYIKLFMPLVIVIPGIAAYVLGAELPVNETGETINDYAYPWLLSNYVMTGVKGLVLAALVAAIISSLASMVNSIATIFSMDIYKSVINKEASDIKLVTVGRIAAVIAMIISASIAPLFKNIDQVFQYIQEFTGFVSPPILAIFLLGLFWKQATTHSVLWAAIAGSIFSTISTLFFRDAIPFLDRMMIVFALTCIVVVVVTHWENKGDDPKAIHIEDSSLFRTSYGFNLAAIGVVAILWLIYTFMQ